QRRRHLSRLGELRIYGVTEPLLVEKVRFHVGTGEPLAAESADVPASRCTAAGRRRFGGGGVRRGGVRGCARGRGSASSSQERVEWVRQARKTWAGPVAVRVLSADGGRACSLVNSIGNLGAVRVALALPLLVAACESPPTPDEAVPAALRAYANAAQFLPPGFSSYAFAI